MRPNLQCSSLHIHAGPCIATTKSPCSGNFTACLPRRHCSLAPRPRHPPGTDAASHVFLTGYRIQTEPCEVLSIPVHVSGLAGCPLAPPVQALASSSNRPVQHSAHGPLVAASSHDYLPPTQKDCGTHQFRVPGTLILPFFPATSHAGQLSCLSRRERPTDHAPHFYVGGTAILDVSGSVDTHHQVSCGSAPSLPLDRCVLSRLGSSAGAVAGGLRKWTTAKCHFHVNVLEMRAVLCVVTFFRFHDLSLCVFTDNETVRYTLASCRTRSLTMRHEMIALLAKLQTQNLWFQVLRIPTTLNVVADALSCEDPLNTEWTLPQPVFGVVYRWAGRFWMWT